MKGTAQQHHCLLNLLARKRERHWLLHVASQSILPPPKAKEQQDTTRRNTITRQPDSIPRMHAFRFASQRSDLLALSVNVSCLLVPHFRSTRTARRPPVCSVI